MGFDDQDLDAPKHPAMASILANTAVRWCSVSVNFDVLGRSVVGLSKRKGRHPVLTERQDANLWEAWSKEVKDRRIALNDDTAMLSLAADLAESTGLPLVVIWKAIQGWIAERLI